MPWCGLLGLTLLAGGVTPIARAQEAQPAGEPEPALADDEVVNPSEGRLIREVRFEGLSRVTDQFARNQLRTSAGRPLEWSTVREDVRRLERLGQFREIQAEVVVEADLSVSVVFKVIEAPIVRSVDVVGNRQIPDTDIQQRVGTMVSLIAGVPRDEYQLGAAQRAVEELYRSRGFYQARVTIDESELDESGIVILRVREGERVKVTDIRFSGNQAFLSKQLQPLLRTKEAWLFEKGVIDDEVISGDVAELVKYYRDRGYLDARASSQIQPSPNGKEAIITFLVEEGTLYTLRSVKVVRLDAEAAAGGDGDGRAAPEVITEAQAKALMPLKPGEAFGVKALEDSVRAVQDAYLKMGYVNAQVRSEDRRDAERPEVDLTILVMEGSRFRAGLVVVQGNDLTQQKVIRRRIAVKPDRWLDGLAVEETERRLRGSGLFNTNPASGRLPTATIQPEDPENPGSRDVLIEVEETNTGSLNFGAAINSDSGVAGLITLTQRNFDIADVPDSFDELLRGKAFRGAGQTFNITASPGVELSTYSATFSEPALFESQYGFTVSGFYREREYDLYDEQRFGGRARIGRRFGEVWSGGLNFRGESIDLFNVNPAAPTEYFAVADRNTLTSVGADLTRSTIDSAFRPSRGTRIELSAEQIGAIGGDFEFTRLSAQHQLFVTIDEDYLGRRTVLSTRTAVGYIPQEDESPFYERFFLGGRSFRGFEFRGVGPTGIRNDTGERSTEHVGGDFSFFFGVEVERPLLRDLLAGVIFFDTGTLNRTVSFEDYRVTAGFGIRLYVPALGQAPLAFDFGFPLARERSDDEQVFSFSIDIPF